LLKLTTALIRLVLPLLVFLAWTPAALAWSWPVQGPVLQPFVYEEAHPYASGQHRGIDIGADAAGERVVAPTAGMVSFAGTVPTSGKSVTIETADGYAVTLTHLGSIAVAKGAAVAEGETVGTIGPSGTPEVDGPYIHLGIRVAADPNGYVDPLGLLPAAPPSSPAPADSTASQPSASGGAAAPPAPAPTPVVAASAPPAITRGSTVRGNRTRLSRHRRGRAYESRAEVQRPRSSQRPMAHGENADARTPHHVATPQPRLSEPASSSRRPVVETAAPREPTGLGAGHELQPSVRAAQGRSHRPPVFTVLLPLLCNGAAALVALAAALVVGTQRRRRADTRPAVGAQVLHLPRPLLEQRRERRAA
jgi:hypothetical protein